MNFNKFKTQKINIKTTIIICAIFILLIMLCSYIYYKKVLNELDANRTESSVLTPITALVKNGIAEINYFATATNAQIVARYPKGNKLATDYIYGEIAKFNEELRDMPTEESSPNQFIAPFSTSSSAYTNTVIYKIYKYTGGAHGNQYSHAIISDINNNLINNKDLLAKYDMVKIEKLVESDLMKQYYEMTKNDSNKSQSEFYKSESGISALKWIKEGSSATSTNYDVVWEDKDNLMIYISQYQAWAYVYGDLTVAIPISKIIKN
jgi:hypothetical protein